MPYLSDAGLIPTGTDLLQTFGIVIVLGLFLLTGRGLAGRTGLPELETVAGWGTVCLVMTLWGVVTSAPLWIAACACAIPAARTLLSPDLRPDREDAGAFLRLLAVAAPLLLLMLSVKPSPPDTFTNQWPNAVYLFDHASFPADDRAPTLSFWPAFPYNL